MKAGDIILIPVPQADGRVKIRPALVLRDLPPFGDLLLCGISPQLHQQVISFDEIIASSDADFLLTGLKTTSLLRLGFLAVSPHTKLAGTIGSVSPSAIDGSSYA